MLNIYNLTTSLYFIIFCKHIYYYIYFSLYYNFYFSLYYNFYVYRITSVCFITWFSYLHILSFIYRLLCQKFSCFVKIHFRYRGGWILSRLSWPCVTIFRFGYAHPLHIYYLYIYSRILRRYLNYNLFLIYDLFQIFKYTNIFLGIRSINNYTFSGFKLARTLILKRTVLVNSSSSYML